MFLIIPSTRRQKARVRRTREMDILSDYRNMDIMLGQGNSNSIGRNLDNVINGQEGHQNSES